MTTSVKGSASKAKNFFENEREFKEGYGKDVFQVLGWAYRPYLASGSLWILLGWIGRLLLLSNSIVMGYWMDSLNGSAIPSYFKNWKSEEFLQCLTALCASGLVLTFIFRIFFSRLSVKAVSSIYDEVTVRVSRFPIRFFDRTPVGRVVTRFSSDYGNMFRLFGGPLSELFGIVFDLIASFFLLFTAPLIGVVCYLLLLAINYSVYHLNKKKIRQVRRDQSFYRSPGVAHFAETVQGASVIRVFGKGSVFFKRFNHLDNKYIQAKTKSLAVNISYAGQMMFATYSIVFLAGSVGLWRVSQGEMSAGLLASIMILLSIAGTNFQMLFDWMAQLEEAFVGVERMNEYLRLPLEAESKIPSWSRFKTEHPRENTDSESSGSALNSAISLEIKDLHFRYGHDLPWILKGLSFSVNKGEKIGIVGRTGAGKTSLFQALQYFYPSEKGEILFDGQALSVAEARRRFAVIPQDPVIFNASLRENLSLATSLNPQATGAFDDATLLQALERVGLTQWLKRFSQPLEMMIEEKGKNLSQGEKQLLVMARMSLIQRPLVLMDEATSSIDPKTEELLVNAMSEIFRGHTQLIIAHRLSTIETCDRILWLKNGKVALFDKPEIVIRSFKSSDIGA